MRVKKYRVCTKCGVLMPLSKFHIDKHGRDGFHPTCKNCANEYYRSRYRVHLEKQRERSRMYRNNNAEMRALTSHNYYVNNKFRIFEFQKEWRRKNKNKILVMRARHRHKYGAHCVLNRAVHAGLVEKLNWCQSCGKEAGLKKTEAHHGSYDRERWLDVVWLCSSCHKHLHVWLRRKKVG